MKLTKENLQDCDSFYKNLYTKTYHYRNDENIIVAEWELPIDLSKVLERFYKRGQDKKLEEFRKLLKIE